MDIEKQEADLAREGITLVDGKGYDSEGKHCYTLVTWTVSGIISPCETRFYGRWEEVK
jgi:hypothetical protein